MCASCSQVKTFKVVQFQLRTFEVVIGHLKLYIHIIINFLVNYKTIFIVPRLDITTQQYAPLITFI